MKKERKNQNQKTTKTINEGKNFLQQCIKQYLTSGDTNQLDIVSFVVVKKTCFHYSQTSTLGERLYNKSRNPKTTDADILDLKQTCLLGILESINEKETDTDLILKNAFRKVNNYLYNMRSVQLKNKPFCYSIEELTENGVQLVEIRKGICGLVKDGESYDFDNETENEKRKQDRKLVLQILKELTPLQKQVAKYLALGESQRQIATKMNRNIKTISEHIQAIRKKAQKIVNNK